MLNFSLFIYALLLKKQGVLFCFLRALCLFRFLLGIFILFCSYSDVLSSFLLVFPCNIQAYHLLVLEKFVPNFQKQLCFSHHSEKRVDLYCTFCTNSPALFCIIRPHPVPAHAKLYQQSTKRDSFCTDFVSSRPLFPRTPDRLRGFLFTDFTLFQAPSNFQIPMAIPCILPQPRAAYRQAPLPIFIFSDRLHIFLNINLWSCNRFVVVKAHQTLYNFMYI